jgi:L-xylulokinase
MNTLTQIVLGVDIGLTGMKTVAFDLRGIPLFEAREKSPSSMPQAHWVERDGRDFWQLFCAMTRDVTDQISAAGGYQIIAIGIGAHGDGIWLVDEEGDAVRPGILSLDSRGIDTAARLNAAHEADMLRITGQNAGPASPATLLSWLKENEPENFDKAASFVMASDFLRGMLTGTTGTDLTGASQAFCDVNTQDYSHEAFELLDLQELEDKAPQIAKSYEAVGGVSVLASRTSGLPEGLPVVAGIHDVDAGAIGAGTVRPGQMAVMAGTWSINEVISDHPKTAPEWYCRSFVDKGQWMNMAISPTGSTNLEWFVQNLSRVESEVLRHAGENPYAFVDYEVRECQPGDDYVTFLPYLYGNPKGIDAAGGFSGIRAWHTRGDLLRAIYEGQAFNHRDHCDPLLDAFDVNDIRVVGGVAQSKEWPQIFADVLGRPISIPVGGEGGALGAAMLAAVGAEAFADLDEAAAAMGTEVRTIEPTDGGVAMMEEHYQRYHELIAQMEPWWATAHKAKA